MNALRPRDRAPAAPQGMISLDLPDVELIFDEDGKVVDAEPEDDAYTHKLIEMFMVEANEALARLFEKLGVPLIRRIHPDPVPGDVEHLQKAAMVAGFKIPKSPDARGDAGAARRDARHARGPGGAHGGAAHADQGGVLARRSSGTSRWRAGRTPTSPARSGATPTSPCTARLAQYLKLTEERDRSPRARTSEKAQAGQELGNQKDCPDEATGHIGRRLHADRAERRPTPSASSASSSSSSSSPRSTSATSCRASSRG
jgi:hypothetical protein